MEIEDITIEDNFEELLEEKRHKELLQALSDSQNIEDNFDKLLEDKRHKEVINVLKEILLYLSKNNTKSLIYSENIEKILGELSKNNTNEDLPKSILTLGKIIEDKLTEIKTKEQSYNWEFIIHRDHKELITKVDAIKK